MYIFEITKPGTFLEHDDAQFRSELESLLNHIVVAFYDANVSLNLFNIERDRWLRYKPGEQWEKDFQKRRLLELQVRKELGLQPYESIHEVEAEVDDRLKKEKWNSGEPPLSHQQRLIYIYARTFLSALDAIDRSLKVISENELAPRNIKNLHEKIESEFPDLRAIRNSAQHLEDRARGLGAGKKPKPLEFQPVKNSLVVSQQGALLLECLQGSKLGYTMADGDYGEIDVSVDSMSKITSIIQDVFNSFSWQGVPQHLPK